MILSRNWLPWIAVFLSRPKLHVARAKRLHEKEHISAWLVSCYCTHIAPEKTHVKQNRKHQPINYCTHVTQLWVIEPLASLYLYIFFDNSVWQLSGWCWIKTWYCSCVQTTVCESFCVWKFLCVILQVSVCKSFCVWKFLCVQVFVSKSVCV